MYSENWIIAQERRLQRIINNLKTLSKSSIKSNSQTKQILKPKSKIKSLAKLSLALGLGGCLWDYFDEAKIISRNLRTIRCGINILYQYKWRFNAQNAEEVHEIIAKDIYETCLINDGLYVKFGQGIAASDHLLPPAYFKWMSLLQDKAKAVTIDKVEQIIKEETGKTIRDIFRSFEEQPVASASIAQVHKAVLKNGDTVAVKVQKPNIKKQFASDMFMHWVICAVVQYAFDLPILQFQKNIEENLEKEIDFKIEERNGEISRKALELINRKNIHIPKYYHQYTSQRLLLSEWIDGIKVTHLKEIEALGINTKDVMNTVISAFAEQIFITGFVHCDPHPGNIFVRKNPKNPKHYQVVLLDFGLCIRLDPEFRKDYAKFWTALFVQDINQMKRIVLKWGIGNQDMFASMQLMKPYQAQKPVHCHKVTSEEVLRLQMKMKSDIKEMMKETHLFPQDLLFVNRNMNLVRSVNKKCGSLVNRINVMARYAQQGSEIQKDILEGNQSYKKQYSSSLMFEFKLWISSVLYSLFSWWVHVRGYRGVEDFLEEQERKKVEQMYEQYGFQVPDHKTFDA